jgi:hypothetical protein
LPYLISILNATRGRTVAAKILNVRETAVLVISICEPLLIYNEFKHDKLRYLEKIYAN